MHGKTIGYEKNPIMNEEFKLLLKKKKKNNNNNNNNDE